ncbi:MAG: hypothetical protein ACK4GO_11895 [Gemmobacter sp.]
MRAALLALTLACGAPAAAQTPDPYALIDGLGAYLEQDDIEGAWRHIDRGIREARRTTLLTPDWAIAFAILADSIRNTGENPAYALRIAEEGLDLARQGGPAFADEAAMLEVSRAYALADLGRFAEAVEAATLSLPSLRARFGDAAADDLGGYVQDWARGDLTAFNTSALTLARRALDVADAALERRDYMAALTAAARADLPPDAGFAPADTAFLMAEARALAGRALFLMGRIPEARATLDEGAARVLAPGWQVGGDPVWRYPLPDASRARMTELFYWRARAALSEGDAATATSALTLAEMVNRAADWRITLLLPRVQLAQAAGDAAAADALLDQARAQAEARGEADHAALMTFYRATNQAAMAATWDAVDLPRLRDATARALAAATPGGVIDTTFLRTEAAEYLLLAGAAEGALDLVQGIAPEAGPTPGDLTRAARRRSAEILIAAAHALASRDPAAICPDVPGMGCALVLPAP